MNNLTNYFAKEKRKNIHCDENEESTTISEIIEKFSNMNGKEATMLHYYLMTKKLNHIEKMLVNQVIPFLQNNKQGIPIQVNLNDDLSLNESEKKSTKLMDTTKFIKAVNKINDEEKMKSSRIRNGTRLSSLDESKDESSNLKEFKKFLNSNSDEGNEQLKKKRIEIPEFIDAKNHEIMKVSKKKERSNSK